MASKMVVDRQRREQRLQRLLQDLRGETVQGLVERLSPFVKEEDDLESAVVCLMDAVDGLLATETRELVEADERNVRTGLRIDGLRRERDEAARELRRALVEIREMATFFFGREVGNELLDVQGPTARAHHRDRLKRQVRRALASLRDPATELPEPRKGIALSPDLKQEWIGMLETARTRLQETLDEMKAGEMERTRAQQTKGVRIELHDDELSAIANLQEALLIVGRKPELARSVWKRQRPVGRPARRKKRKRKATQRTGKGSPKKTTTRKAGSKMSSKEVASS